MGIDAGVFKSVDGGSSWPIRSLEWCYITALSIDPNDTDIIYVYAGSLYEGVYKSTNGGTG